MYVGLKIISYFVDKYGTENAETETIKNTSKTPLAPWSSHMHVSCIIEKKP